MLQTKSVFNKHTLVASCMFSPFYSLCVWGGEKSLFGQMCHLMLQYLFIWRDVRRQCCKIWQSSCDDMRQDAAGVWAYVENNGCASDNCQLMCVLSIILCVKILFFTFWVVLIVSEIIWKHFSLSGKKNTVQTGIRFNMKEIMQQTFLEVTEVIILPYLIKWTNWNNNLRQQ